MNSTENVLDIGIQVADAVGAADDRGIVHRDLKPGNVLLTQTGQVKILDSEIRQMQARASAFARSAPGGEAIRSTLRR